MSIRVLDMFCGMSAFRSAAEKIGGFEFVGYCDNDPTAIAAYPSQVISIIDSKESLPKGFDKIMGHTYYVCALYYFIKKDFVTAYDYSERSLNELIKEKSADFIQVIKSKLILALSLQHIKKSGIGLQYSSNTEIVNETIADIKQFLGSDSFYLAYPYKLLKMYSESKAQKDLYADYYDQIQNKCRQEKDKMKKEVDSYFNTIK